MAVEQTIRLLEQVVRDIPIGTNLALFWLLWAILCGAFLQSRGAIFPALQSLGLKRAPIRRCSQALRKGAWTIDALLQPPGPQSWPRAAGNPAGMRASTPSPAILPLSGGLT